MSIESIQGCTIPRESLLQIVDNIRHEAAYQHCSDEVFSAEFTRRLFATVDKFVPGEVKPEPDYHQIVRLGAKLGIPVVEMFVKVEATNPDGSPGEKWEGRGRTFNRNFWNAVFTMLGSTAVSSGTFGAGVLSVKDTGGTTRTIKSIVGSGNCNYGLEAAIADATAGIVVGTGSTAESFEDNTLVTKIAHGTGAGQLSYAAQTPPTPSYVAGTKVWTSSPIRIFNNNSAGTIVVAETGFYATVTDSTANFRLVMIERSKLGATVSVLAAGQLTVTYSISLTFAN